MTFYKIIHIDILKFASLLKGTGDDIKSLVAASNMVLSVDVKFTDKETAESMNTAERESQDEVVKSGKWKNNYVALLGCELYALVETEVSSAKAGESFEVRYIDYCPIIKNIFRSNFDKYVESIEWFVSEEDEECRYIKKLPKSMKVRMNVTCSFIEISYASISIIYPSTMNMIVIKSSLFIDISTKLSHMITTFTSDHELRKGDVYSPSGTATNLGVVHFSQSKLSLNNFFSDDAFFDGLHKLEI